MDKLATIVRSAVLAAVLASWAASAPAGAAAQAGEWRPLLKGETLEGWVNGRGEPATPGGWAVEEGELRRKGRAGDLFTSEHFRDFEMEFEWKVSRAGNSGVKYRLYRPSGGGWLGPEYQVLDDDHHPDARQGMAGNRKSASLYDVVPASADKALRPVGEWNQARIVARGDHIEHWLNGRKVVEVDLTSDDWRRRLAASKFGEQKGVQDWFAREAGPILLQDHGDEVAYRNLRIRPL